jgi:5-phospho-D-xylono-1,4-lactonase
MKLVRTVRGDIPPEQLGFTLGHEHLIGHPPQGHDEGDLYLSDEDDAVRELEAFRRAGGGALVEMTTVDYHRNVRALERISRRTGVHVVAATGFNKAKFAESYSSMLGEEEIATWMISEITEGIIEPPAFVNAHGVRSSVRAGIIKGSSSLDGPTAGEEKVLRAAAQTHFATGAPVSTHTEKATWALEQASYLIDRGVAPGKLLIGHLDFLPDLTLLGEIASLGVFLGLDQFSKEKYLSDAKRIDLVLGLCAAGFDEQLILSGDMARRSYWSVHGGPGFLHLPNRIDPMLAAHGLTQAQRNRLFKDNPARWLELDVQHSWNRKQM